MAWNTNWSIDILIYCYSNTLLRARAVSIFEVASNTFCTHFRRGNTRCTAIITQTTCSLVEISCILAHCTVIFNIWALNTRTWASLTCHCCSIKIIALIETRSYAFIFMEYFCIRLAWSTIISELKTRKTHCRTDIAFRLYHHESSCTIQATWCIQWLAATRTSFITTETTYTLVKYLVLSTSSITRWLLRNCTDLVGWAKVRTSPTSFGIVVGKITTIR